MTKLALALLAAGLTVTAACSTTPTTEQKGVVTTQPTAAPTTTTAGLTFKSCAEAKAAGHQDIKKGSPGYSTNLDGNRDGVACETEKPEARVGLPAVYDEIAAETDCGELQATFDRAETTSKRDGGPPNGPAFVQERYGNWSEIGIAYMKAADDRMSKINCY